MAAATAGPQTQAAAVSQAFTADAMISKRYFNFVLDLERAARNAYQGNSIFGLI